MELKEYLEIIKKHLKLFLCVTSFFALAVPGYFYFQPARHEAYLGLNVTRLGIQNTPDYRYDGFYRLQADEKFAETLVEWLKSPRLGADIAAESENAFLAKNLKDFGRFFSAEKRSSQLVTVKYSSQTPQDARKISLLIEKIIEKKLEKLNETQKDGNWFRVVAEDPLILKKNHNYPILFLAGILAGIFLAFWGVLIRHYLKKP